VGFENLGKKAYTTGIEKSTASPFLDLAKQKYLYSRPIPLTKCTSHNWLSICRKLTTMDSELSSIAIRERVENSTRPETAKMAEEAMSWYQNTVVASLAVDFFSRVKLETKNRLVEQNAGEEGTKFTGKGAKSKQNYMHLNHQDTVLGSRFHAIQISCIMNRACAGTAVPISADRSDIVKRMVNTKAEVKIACSSTGKKMF
jgi:hypothetical protein